VCALSRLPASSYMLWDPVVAFKLVLRTRTRLFNFKFSGL
jgi:hypothetical protein